MYDVVMENHNEEAEQGIYAPNLERLMRVHDIPDEPKRKYNFNPYDKS